MEGRRYRDPAGFELTLAPGWEVEPDEEGGVLLAKEDGPGLLHVIAFPDPGQEQADPAEELYAFLEDQEIELQEDEIDDVLLADGGEMAVSEYLSEDEEGGEEGPTYWMVAVATAPGTLVFANYSCPGGEEAAEREEVLGMLMSISMGTSDTREQGTGNG